MFREILASALRQIVEVISEKAYGLGFQRNGSF